MFSTIDHPGTRRLKVFVVSKDGVKTAVERRFYKDVERNFRTLPTKKRFDQAVGILAQRSQSLFRSGSRYLIVQYWKYDYEKAGAKVRKKLIFPKRVPLVSPEAP